MSTYGGGVEVMYTDSRHVAKRGSRVGQMKDAKRLGTIWASPQRVMDAARDAQSMQGWLSANSALAGDSKMCYTTDPISGSEAVHTSKNMLVKSNTAGESLPCARVQIA